MQTHPTNSMRGVRLGGVDPSILRELSGVYKPFVKAFKELVSNAFDADATKVDVTFEDGFSAVTVIDNGNGMTPFEFRSDFTRIGGGSRRWSGDKTPGGRLRIGSKGIGFLALARYCDRLWVQSVARRDYETSLEIEATKKRSISIHEQLGIPLAIRDLGTRSKVKATRHSGGKLRDGHDFTWDEQTCRIAFAKDFGLVDVNVKVHCSDLRFKACLGFSRLLQLADNADLEEIDDFATIQISKIDPGESVGTQITAEGLKPFLQRELRADRKKGFVRNIASQSGFEQFRWQPFGSVDSVRFDNAFLMLVKTPGFQGFSF